jgi:hypothetical protein
MWGYKYAYCLWYYESYSDAVYLELLARRNYTVYNERKILKLKGECKMKKLLEVMKSNKKAIMIGAGVAVVGFVVKALLSNTDPSDEVIEEMAEEENQDTSAE